MGKSDKIEDTSIVESVIEESETKSCPKCGAKLALRQGKHGEFYGCSRFPNCKFSKNV